MDVKILSDEEKKIKSEAEKKRIEFAEEVKKKQENHVLVRYPNGFVKSCTPEIAEVYLSKQKGHRRVSSPPPIDNAKLRIEVENEK